MEMGNEKPSGNSKLNFWRIPIDADRIKRINAEVYIEEELCKGCEYCVEFCPGGVLETSKKRNSKGYHPPEVIHPEKCTGCGFCQRVCPEFAIIVEKVEERVK